MKLFYFQLKGAIVVILILASFAGFAQNVGINSTGNAPASSAGLDVDFSNKGVLIPRISLQSLTDVSTISAPTESLIIYNTNTAYGKGFFYYNGSKWVPMAQFTSGSTASPTLGIGTSNPLNTLSVYGTNPLALHGLQNGTNADSILTVSGGVVKKLSAGSITVSSSNAWSLAGNAIGTNTYFMGSTDAKDVNFRTNNTQAMKIDATGNVAIGSAPTFTTSPNAEKLLVDAGTTTSYNVISGKGTINSYLQLNIQNKSNGTSASSDIVASNDAATEAANFIDVGINSSGNTSTGILGGANTAYVYSTGGDLAIGNSSTTGDISIFTGGTASTNERIRINDAGQVGIGTSTFTVDPKEKVLIDAGTTYNTGVNTMGNINDYFQVVVQNKNSNSKASSDFVVSSNIDSNYVDFGINSSGYATNKSNILNQIYTPYLYASSPQWFYIGHGVPGKGLVFFTNGDTKRNQNNSADGSPRLEITSTGNVGIGDFSTSSTEFAVTEKLMVDGNITPKTDNSTTSSLGTSSLRWKQVYSTNGTIQTSDRRLKTNINPLTYGLKQILSLDPVSYNWKSDPNGGRKVGLIAQDAKKVVPEVVVGDETKENLGVNYAELVPVLINAIKEQQKQIEELKAKVAILEKK